MKNKYEIRGETTVVFVEYQSQSMEALISTSDLELVKKAISWTARYEYYADSFYVVGTVCEELEGGKLSKKPTSMHRHIMGQPEGLCVDHINHIRNDNRRCNLQVLTRSQNSAKMPETYKQRFIEGNSLTSLAMPSSLKNSCIMMAAKNGINLNEYLNMIIQKEINNEMKSLINTVLQAV